MTKLQDAKERSGARWIRTSLNPESIRSYETFLNVIFEIFKGQRWRGRDVVEMLETVPADVEELPRHLLREKTRWRCGRMTARGRW